MNICIICIKNAHHVSPHFADEMQNSLIKYGINPFRGKSGASPSAEKAEGSMGEGRKHGVRVGFDGSVRLGFHGGSNTSDAGLIASCELDDAPGLTEIAETNGKSRIAGSSGPSDRVTSYPDWVCGKGGGNEKKLMALSMLAYWILMGFSGMEVFCVPKKAAKTFS